jgi:hypothetical protein
MATRSSSVLLQTVRGDSIVRAAQIHRACSREPEKFEPVPDAPIFQDGDTTYRLGLGALPDWSIMQALDITVASTRWQCTSASMPQCTS